MHRKMSRERANARERNRQKSIGNAFNVLRNHLPKQLRDRKPSKAETLKSAAEYISHLLRILGEQMENHQKSPKKEKLDFVSQTRVWIPPEHQSVSFCQH